MKSFRWFDRLRKNREGAVLIEYLFLVAFIVFFAIVGIKALGSRANTAFENLATDLAGIKTTSTAP